MLVAIIAKGDSVELTLRTERQCKGVVYMNPKLHFMATSGCPTARANNLQANKSDSEPKP